MEISKKQPYFTLTYIRLFDRINIYLCLINYDYSTFVGLNVFFVSYLLQIVSVLLRLPDTHVNALTRDHNRYSTMDNVDGKQARRTGTSSPLGELFE